MHRLNISFVKRIQSTISTYYSEKIVKRANACLFVNGRFKLAAGSAWWALAEEILAALTLALINDNFIGANTNANLQKFYRR